MKTQTPVRLIITTLTVPARAALICLLLMLMTVHVQAQQNDVLMRLDADGNQMHNETVIYFDSAATYNYDPQLDAPFLGVNDGFLAIVTRLSNIDYQVNAVPSITQNMVIPVKITTGTSGTYSVYVNNLHDLPEGAYIHLKDLYNNADFDLRAGVVQLFISDTETVARFQVIISANMLHNVSTTSIEPTCSTSGNGAIHATASGPGPFNFYWKDSLNNIIRTALNTGGADTLSGANAGRYRVDVTTPGTNNNATVYLNLQGSLSARAGFQVPSGIISLNNGIASVHFSNTSQNAQSYLWDFGDGMGSNLTSPTHNYNQVGTYTVTLTATNNACSDVSVQKEVITIDASMQIDTHTDAEVQVLVDAAGTYIQTAGNEGTITISDLSGRELLRKKVLNNVQKVRLDASLPEREILVIRFEGNDRTSSAKFIKQ